MKKRFWVSCIPSCLADATHFIPMDFFFSENNISSFLHEPDVTVHLAFFIPIKGGTIIDFLWEQITNWLKKVPISGIISNLTGMTFSPERKSGCFPASPY
ncbi:MAG: hypothetical protein ACI3XG_08120 [Faecousia sp.]